MIILDDKNFRKHNSLNKELINKSLKKLGAGRSILIDSDDKIIAGNGVYEQAKKLGIKEKIIESDGTELIIVKRIDLKSNSKKRNELALIDNYASDTSEFIISEIYDNFETTELKEWYFDIKPENYDFFQQNDTTKNEIENNLIESKDKQKENKKDTYYENIIIVRFKDDNEKKLFYEKYKINPNKQVINFQELNDGQEIII